MQRSCSVVWNALMVRIVYSSSMSCQAVSGRSVWAFLGAVRMKSELFVLRTSGLRKTYWISCQEELVLQHVAVDKRSLPSNFVVKPRDFNRLLGNFQSSLQELTLFATQPSETPPESETGTESKAIELRSYTDFVKGEENVSCGLWIRRVCFVLGCFPIPVLVQVADTADGGALHTQLWIDPAEELQSYSHVGAAVDVTFSLKDLKVVW